ncbi:CinA family protein [Microbacterium ulmi]|uniref:CinA family protein n=2 Tax=Microbacterium ulmi TaxID=179095 RepID=A0A7Y2Q1E3_9MICO|nr:CinA family protein [Microbacterium ulmi]NNH03820.1 CinA family protein [Microbacterium ulmi]
MSPPSAAVDRLARSASRTGTTIAVAESLTSGLLASAVGAGEDAATWFAGAIVAYQSDVKERVLGVEPGIDPCSAECAEQLAIGVRRVLGADVSVAATGVGGPDPQDGHPPGTVFLGWATAGTAGHVRLALPGAPEEVVAEVVRQAVRLLDRLVEAAQHPLVSTSDPVSAENRTPARR